MLLVGIHRNIVSRQTLGRVLRPSVLVRMYSIPPDLEKTISARIPGQAKQTNNLSDRLPRSLKLEKEAMPSLLPHPNAPEPSKYPLAKMFAQLKRAKEPELIYESENHRLYFVFCYCFGLVFLIYGINVLSIGHEMAMNIYEENENNLSDLHNNLRLGMHLSIVAAAGILTALCGVAFALAPSRLVRRMWYLPGGDPKEPFVRFTSHPVLPYKPTPVHTMPLSHLRKNKFAKVYTGDGFYGTGDSIFIFWLNQKGSRAPWLIDRKGFFWGDGRVFDLLFSDDTIDYVERSKKIDEMYGDLLRKKREKDAQLKKEHGFGWRTKAASQLMVEDIKKILDADKVPQVSEKGEKVNKKNDK
ncbi:hypothetical protein KL938_002255 [Ogataea parapolymorpha]|nr:hypothetical protein KL938_002255 [Ogataea parapolymorpha]